MIDTNNVKVGDYWSNVNAETGLFKNYGQEVRVKVPRRTRAKFIFRALFCHPKPAMGYTKFFQRWHTTCGVAQRLAQLLEERRKQYVFKTETAATATDGFLSSPTNLSLSKSTPDEDTGRASSQTAAPCQGSTARESKQATRIKDLVCWLGHASQLLCLVEGNVNILFDPIFSPRASPFSFIGPKRKFPPPLKVKSLPPIDLVLISHNHYDHLDKCTIVSLHKRFPWVQFVVPLKMETLLLPWGIPSSHIIALNWWEEVEVRLRRPATPFYVDSVQLADSLSFINEGDALRKGDCTIKSNEVHNSDKGDGSSIHLRIAATPAQHYGLHWINDYNKVLWCGWCLGWKSCSSDSPPPLVKPGSLLPISLPIAPIYRSFPAELVKDSNETGVEKMVAVDSSSTCMKNQGVGSFVLEQQNSEQSEWNWDSSELKTYFFTGDTSFNREIFEQIHLHYPRISMAGLPIGAYSPREMLKYAHIDPESAVEIFEIMQIQRSYGLHWATFELGGEPLDEPPEVLKKALDERSLSFCGLEEVEDGRRCFHAIPTGSFLEF